jgi:hypothetical protein
MLHVVAPDEEVHEPGVMTGSILCSKAQEMHVTNALKVCV